MSQAALVASFDSDQEFAGARADILSGRGASGAARLQALISGGMASPAASYWLAAAKGACGDWAGFRRQLVEAQESHALALAARVNADLARLEVDPDYAAEVGQAFYKHGHVGVAAACYHKAARAAPKAMTFLNLGLAYQHQGRMEEAALAFRRALELSPTSSQAHSFLLYALFFVDDGVRRHAEEAGQWRRRYGVVPPPPPFANPPLTARRLKVGYVVPTLESQAGRPMRPILENHDRSKLHTTLYLTKPEPAAAGLADSIRGIGHLSDAAAANLIRADEIDVLVDLWGHTAHGRLGVFVHKPAPVQVSWLNYIQTTGVPEIDYMILADCMVTPGAQDLCAEKIWPIGPVRALYRPDPRPSPAPTPAKATGSVTFASYNHPSRLNDQTVAAWARILRGVPGSTLVLRYRFFIDEILQNSTLMRFAARGVEPERIVFGQQLAQPAYYASFADIDLALDPSPCPGGTTTCDALANGVPVLTLAAEDYYSRIGQNVLEPSGLPELVAFTWDDYVQRAIDLTSDLDALDALRARVRPGFDASPRRDEVGYTHRLEAAFAEMFERWRSEGAKP